MSFLDWVFGPPPPSLQAVAAPSEAKKATIPFTPEPLDVGYSDPYNIIRYSDDTWFDASWGNLVNQLFLINSALGACILKYALGYNEPPPLVKVRDEEKPDHALQRLLDRPNPLMSHAELKAIDIIYRIVGGNTYFHKVRGGGGQVVELWPYHAGQMWPVPSQYNWVQEYEYDAGRGLKKRIPASEIIHLKWPIPDLRAPWKGMSPLELIAREVLTDSEAARFAYALLKNDAIPKGVVTVPEGTPMSPATAEKLRNKFKKDHGGDNRGGVVILEQGAAYTRVSMNPQEMDLSALRRVPEARIAGNLGMSPMVGHLTAGLERSTYSNSEQAYREVVQGTFVPMWRSDGNELTQALQNEYPDKPTIAYNTSLVASLQESTDDKYNRTLKAFDSNVTMLDEARALIDLPPVDQVIAGDTRGKLFAFEMVNASTIAPPQPRIVDVTPQPAQLEDVNKAYKAVPMPIWQSIMQYLDSSVGIDKTREIDAIVDANEPPQLEDGQEDE